MVNRSSNRCSWADFFKSINILCNDSKYIVDDKRKVNSDYLIGFLENQYGQQKFITHSDELINDFEETDIFKEVGGVEASFNGTVYIVNNTSFELDGSPYKVNSEAIAEFIDNFYNDNECLLFDGGDVIFFGGSGSQSVLLIYHHECRSLTFKK